MSTVGIGLLLSAFWLVPFGLERAYATSMGYMNLTTYLHQLFPEADTWALVLAGVGVVMAVLLRSRFGLTVTVLGAAFALAEVFDPQGSLYNVRLLPMWFISVYLMAAWAFGVGLHLGGRGLAPGETAALGALGGLVPRAGRVGGDPRGDGRRRRAGAVMAPEHRRGRRRRPTTTYVPRRHAGRAGGRPR